LEERLTDSRPRSQIVILTITIFAGYFIFGLSEMVKGPAIPRIQADLNIGEFEVGLLLACNAFGYLIACSFAAQIARKIGMKRLFMISMLVMVLSGFMIRSSNSFAMLMVGFFVLYLGNGAVEITLGVMAAVTYTKRTGQMLNLAHTFYGVGAAVGPIVAAALMTAQIRAISDEPLGWHGMYLVVLSWALIPFISAIFAKYGSGAQENMKINYREYLKDPELWSVILILTFGGFAEMGMGGWLANYYEKANGFTPEKAALILTIFFAAFTFARIILGPFTDKFGYIFSLMLFSLIAGLLIIVGVLLGPGGVVPIVLSAAFLSPIYPTVMAAIAKIFAKTIDTAMTVVMTTMGVISLPANLLISGIIEGLKNALVPSYGDQSIVIAYSAGLLLIALCSLLAFVFAFWLRRRLIAEDRLV